mmetsp:Transcript_16791/g.18216  ORF Transcript_16791/g.18216 Transcript_16791/m.18216 type:complete len:86 (+) Transcript_16791:981-1238(+)
MRRKKERTCQKSIKLIIFLVFHFEVGRKNDRRKREKNRRREEKRNELKRRKMRRRKGCRNRFSKQGEMKFVINSHSHSYFPHELY